jgi:aurora kinase
MKLGDFGCAVHCDRLRHSFVGSPCYLSPEQLRSEDYDEKVDIWEIGIMTYELLYNFGPF